MSSWLVSLHGTGGSIVRFGRRLEKHGFATPCIPDGLFNAGPGRLGAEAAAEIVQQNRDLIVGHAVGERWHDRTTFTRDGPNARQDNVDGVARIWRAEGRAETKIDSAIRQRPVG